MKSVSQLTLMAKLLVVNSLLLLVSACSESHSNEATQSYVQSAQIEQIEHLDYYQVKRQYIGKVSAKQQTNLAFEFGGRVLEVLKDSGDRVKKGNILAVQDAELLHIKAREINAQIEQVNAQIELNQTNLTRAKELRLRDYASEQLVDELSAQRSILQANLNGLKASYNALYYQISKATLRAPYDGVIHQRKIAQGDMLAAGVTAFTLVNQNQTEITLGIPAKIAASLSIAQILDVDINNTNYQASILAIGQQIEPTTRTVNLRLQLAENFIGVSGTIAKVNIVEKINADGFWLPLTALTDGIRGQWNIYLAQPQGQHFKVVAETVTVLHTTKDKAFISGLNNDSLSVITTGVHRYVPGQLVNAQGANE